MRIGFLFPGQGAQSIGMGKDLYEQFAEVKKIYEDVEKITGINVADLTFSGTEEELSQTKNTQIAILTMSLGILEILKNKGIQAEYAAGLSLGEYTALAYAEAISKEDVIAIVQKRGEYMQNLVPEGNWAMAAVIGMEDKAVEELCQKVTNGFAVPANYNCPGQVAVSGNQEGIDQLIEIAKTAGAKRVIPLKTSGPFHTEKLNAASDALKEALQSIEIKAPNCKVIKNLDAKPYTSQDNIKEILTKHVMHPVRFSDSVEYMITHGVDTFIEIGPGKVLTGFVRKINKNIKCYTINDVPSLENTLQEIM